MSPNVEASADKADNRAVMTLNKESFLLRFTTITTTTTMTMVNKAALPRVKKLSWVPVGASTTLNGPNTPINPAVVSVKAMSAPLERKPPTSAATIVLPHLTPVRSCAIEVEDNTTTLKRLAQLARVLVLALGLPQLNVITTIIALASVNRVNRVNRVTMVTMVTTVNKVKANIVNKVNKVHWANKVNLVNKADTVATLDSAHLRVDMALVKRATTAAPEPTACKVVT
jgi:hypothetical protein